MRLTVAATLLAATPMLAFAVGSGSLNPPTPTETTEDCAEGLVFDLATQTCMTPEQSTNDDSAMMDAVRELAYAGRYADARTVLDQLDPADSMVQTYYGFTARKTGDVDGAMSFYQTALTIDPDNNLARSYMGQGMVAMGDLVGAQAQLSEIRARDGRQTWAEVALRMAIDTGTGPSY
ncbi:tetratricopeptide repeat protein [Pseudooctadecabacter sp.]|uniref:tetratricopeptide repeat protein n=1 Tax=Pseudooctadecabacter sp. TaxID=1966338 RepID=UPI0035C86C22